MHARSLRHVVGAALLAVLAASSPAIAQRQKGQSNQPELSAQGRKLEARYQKELDALRSELTRLAPKVGAKQKQAFLSARQAEEQAAAALVAAQKELSKLGTARALVGHAKGKWIGGADRGIKKAQSMLEKARTDSDRKKARAELEKWQQNRADGVQALAERQAALERAERDHPARPSKQPKPPSRAARPMRRAHCSDSD